MEEADIARLAQILAQILTELSTKGQSNPHNWVWVHRDDVNQLAAEGLAILQGKKKEV